MEEWELEADPGACTCDLGTYDLGTSDLGTWDQGVRGGVGECESLEAVTLLFSSQPSWLVCWW